MENNLVNTHTFKYGLSLHVLLDRRRTPDLMWYNYRGFDLYVRWHFPKQWALYRQNKYMCINLYIKHAYLNVRNHLCVWQLHNIKYHWKIENEYHHSAPMLHVIPSYVHALFHLLSLFLIHFASLNAQLLYKLELSPESYSA